jgi:hypothetical protein
MEYAVKAETTRRRDNSSARFPIAIRRRSSSRPIVTMAARLARTDSAGVLPAPTESADCSFMTHEGIEFVILRVWAGTNGFY